MLRLVTEKRQDTADSRPACCPSAALIYASYSSASILSGDEEFPLFRRLLSFISIVESKLETREQGTYVCLTVEIFSSPLSREVYGRFSSFSEREHVDVEHVKIQEESAAHRLLYKCTITQSSFGSRCSTTRIAKRFPAHRRP